jgi:drug/metabolite transporter (DMT)-like permease
MGTFARMRRPTSVELMLLVTVVLWALNITVTRYVLTHGLHPLAYATLRYGAAAAIFVGLTLVLEGSFRVDRKAVPLVAGAAALLFLNQLGFVYSLDRTTASTVGLILGATPIFAALIGLVFGLERLGGRFWAGTIVSFAGVALVATGAGGELSGDVGGNLLAVVTAATWAAYSVLITPLMARYSPFRVSALVLVATWVGLAAIGAPQTTDQQLSLGWAVWALFGFAVLGPLVTTNVLWFRSLHRIGPARATLAANLQPFVAVVFAVILLSESMTAVQVVGGVLIALGIVLARRRPAPPVTAPTPVRGAAPGLGAAGSSRAASTRSRSPSRY